MPSDLLHIPEPRQSAIERITPLLRQAKSVAITTHVNADGDACGSAAAMTLLLSQMGIRAHVVNPTPWPALFGFLLGADVEDRTAAGAAALRGIDALLVLDVSEMKRLGQLAPAVRALDVPRIVLDHHVAGDEPAGDVLLTDESACATGELVYDLAMSLGLEITTEIANALYAAILTDTGGFRYSNTSPRAHVIAAMLMQAGVDPEDMFRRIYASLSMGRLHLLRDSLHLLGVDAEHGIAWISVTADALERYDVSPEDLDGIVEHPRSIAGTRLALFFRDLGYGKVKVSFRSTGDVDVNLLARQFGGGGHAKASGALIPGTLDDVRARVLDAARQHVGRLNGGAPA
ncbi:MAG: bifunctional oligoribonuclease/PAP phosphatase NrnA [Gemmatimonadota bacterium]